MSVDMLELLHCEQIAVFERRLFLIQQYTQCRLGSHAEPSTEPPAHRMGVSVGLLLMHRSFGTCQMAVKCSRRPSFCPSFCLTGSASTRGGDYGVGAGANGTQFLDQDPTCSLHWPVKYRATWSSKLALGAKRKVIGQLTIHKVASAWACVPG